VGSIKVGAAEAVVKARESGSASGTVPKNVVVGGVFAQTPSGIDAGLEMGVWSITFATGTDLVDARKSTVDMMSGEVAKAADWLQLRHAAQSTILHLKARTPRAKNSAV
jgi:hypothetical protein